MFKNQKSNKDVKKRGLFSPCPLLSAAENRLPAFKKKKKKKWTSVQKTAQARLCAEVFQTNELHSFLQNAIYSVGELFVSIGCSNQK